MAKYDPQKSIDWKARWAAEFELTRWVTRVTSAGVRYFPAPSRAVKPAPKT